MDEAYGSIEAVVEVAIRYPAVSEGVPVATKLVPSHVVRAFVTNPIELIETVPEVVIVPPVNPLPVATEVTVPAFCVRQEPLIAKQPEERVMPFEAVEVALAPVRLR